MKKLLARLEAIEHKLDALLARPQFVPVYCPPAVTTTPYPDITWENTPTNKQVVTSSVS